MIPLQYEGRSFDWAPSPDPRWSNFMLREIVEPQTPTPVMWRCDTVLDQGHEGACVGFGQTCDLISSPRPDPYTTASTGNQYALGLYHRAQQLDDWPGENYEGTSVNAGFQVSRERGFIDSWRWMTTPEEVRDAVISSGPVVLGIKWYQDMYTTRPSGLVKVGGAVVGGHCITIRGYHPGMRITGEDWNARFEVFKWQNSWGTGYGKNGLGYIKFEDLRTLLNDEGEAGVAIGRHQVRLASAA